MMRRNFQRNVSSFRNSRHSIVGVKFGLSPFPILKIKCRKQKFFKVNFTSFVPRTQMGLKCKKKLVTAWSKRFTSLQAKIFTLVGACRPLTFVVNQKKTLVSDDRLWVLLWGLRQALSLCFHLKTGSFRVWCLQVVAKFDFSEIENFEIEMVKTIQICICLTVLKACQKLSNQNFHRVEDFNDTTLDAVQASLGRIRHKHHKGMIPNTFAATGIETIAFAHIDLDIYQSVKDACLFVYEKAASGAIIIFDDYGFPVVQGQGRLWMNSFRSCQNKFWF